MRKILLISTLIILAILAFFVTDIWNTVSQKPNTEFGHLILRDRTWKIITDKWRSGGYALPYRWKLNTDLVRNIVTIEDTRFYEHHGINLSAKIASLYQNIQAGGIVRGGSTITEQYVKNAYYNTRSRTILQKIREAIGALIIEQKYTKDKILENYLSTVYMGNGTYGIETVMGENPDNGTILDTITRLKFPNITISNSGTVMEYRTKISNKLGIAATNTHLFESKKRNSTNTYPILTSRADREVSLYCQKKTNTLKQWTLVIPENLCDTSEINLTLTIDADLMNTAYKISQGTLKSLEWKNVTNASVYILDPRTNTILVYIGSANPQEEIDMITRRRSVGSLLKPFIYLLALRSWADTEDYILDDKTPYETGIDGKYFVPENYNPMAYGPVRLREALGNSLNAATVRITDTLWISNIYNWLHGFGISMGHDAGYYGYGISLGTVETSMENIVSSYRSLLDYQDPDTWQIGQILSDSRNRARTFGISSILNTSVPQSVKTWTSTDFRDNWTVSYSSDAIIGVWVGNTDGSSMGDVSGVTGAWPIWKALTEAMIERWMIKNQKNPPPNILKQIPICLDTKCFRKELMYSKKSESPNSRPSESKYFSSDFYGKITLDEMEKWNIQ
jgi:penicillin-binding protein 1C